MSAALSIFALLTVVAPERTDARAELEAKIARSLPEDLSLRSIRLPPTTALDLGSAEVQFRGAPRRGSNQVQLIDPRSGRRMFVEIQLASMQNVMVAAHALPVGAVITEADLVRERRAAEAEISSYAVVGRTVRTAIPRGEIISPNLLEKPTPLPRGTELYAEIQRGGARLSIEGRLERPAAIGDRAELKVLSTGRILRGVLGADGAVHVEGAAP